jgi:hypothetical protein
MFVGAGVGAGVGAVAGGIYGGIQAHQKIESLPLNSVQLPGYQQPLYEDRVVGSNTNFRIDFTGENPYGNGYSSYQVTARFPLHNPDGSVKMDNVAPRTVAGHGTPVRTDAQVPIKEPTGATVQTYVDDNGGTGVSTSSQTTVHYRTVGTYVEPQVKFETGVSTLGHVLGYAAAGAVLGAVGGALVGAALDRSQG